jgi:hypothetical protein
MSSSEHEMENSPQIETQHGTHRGAEGEFDRLDSGMNMQNVHVGQEDRYMQPNADGMERFLTPSVHEENLTVTPQSRRARRNLSVHVSESEDQDGAESDIDVDAMVKMFAKLMRRSGKSTRVDHSDSKGGKQNQAVVLSPRKVTTSSSDMMYANIALSGIKLPKLENKLFLENHLDRVSSILGEMDLLEDGRFDPKYKHRLMAIVSESLGGVTEVSKSFEDLERFGHDWGMIRKSLLSQFCSRASLRFTLKEKLSSLKFTKPYTKFINDVKEIYYLHKRFYTDKGEVGSLVRKVIEVLPNFISRPIVKDLVLTDEDWEHAMSFEQFLRKVEANLIVSETCDSVIQNNKSQENRSYVKDKVAAVREGRKDWLEEWVRSKDGVLYCCGPEHRDEVLQAARNNTKLEVKTFDKGKNGPYALVGFNDMQAPTFQCSSRPFVIKPKNM